MPSKVVLGDLLRIDDLPDTFFEGVELTDDWECQPDPVSGIQYCGSLDFKEFRAIFGYLEQFLDARLPRFYDYWYQLSMDDRRKLMKPLLPQVLKQKMREIGLELRESALWRRGMMKMYSLHILTRGDTREERFVRSKSGGPNMMDIFVYFLEPGFIISVHTTLLQLRRLLRENGIHVRSCAASTTFVSLIDTVDGRLKFEQLIKVRNRAKALNTIQALYDVHAVCSIDEAGYLRADRDGTFNLLAMYVDIYRTLVLHEPDPFKYVWLCVKGCHTCSTRLKTLKACSACLKVFYCGPECQRKDWKAHRAVCKLMKGASAISYKNSEQLARGFLLLASNRFE
ncbi:hypothetical protein HDV05_008592 [Chytridiales sp. JEL 0842]|nr:hypothetical protein HDV05_008592 [Chytridiales sp. JEL 0842]